MLDGFLIIYFWCSGGEAYRHNLQYFRNLSAFLIVLVFSTGSCRWVSSSKEFLFSLYNINGYSPVKLEIKLGNYGYAKHQCSNYGPIFGNGFDLVISSHSGFTCCGVLYPLPPGYSGPSRYSCTFFAGGSHSSFTLTDIEVFYETST